MRLCGGLGRSASVRGNPIKDPNATGGDPSDLAVKACPPRAARLIEIKQGRLGGKSKMSPIKLLNKSPVSYTHLTLPTKA